MAEAEPCRNPKCQTTGGYQPKGDTKPERKLGLCAVCYKKRWRAKRKPPDTPKRQKAARQWAPRNWKPSKAYIEAKCLEIRSEPGWREYGSAKSESHSKRIYRAIVPKPREAFYDCEYFN